MNYRQIILSALIASVAMAQTTVAAGFRGRADKHAPAGIANAHTHRQGTWMVEYKYMGMFMDDNRVGSHTIDDYAALPVIIGDPLDDVPISTNNGATPTQMTMEMHMLHVMYGLTDEITLYSMLMMPSLTMDHIRGPAALGASGTQFTTHNSGFGDLSLGALLLLYTDPDDDLIFNMGISLPTGDIYRTSTIPTGSPTPLPFPMRLGSGTVNARPGITWKRYRESGSFGIQLQTDMPIGKNYRDYAVSSEFRFSTWCSHLITDWLAVSLRLENLWLTNVDGGTDSDDSIVSTNVENFRGGYNLNAGVGFSALLHSHLFSVELIPTLYQDLHGIQLETDWSLAASWSKGF